MHVRAAERDAVLPGAPFGLLDDDVVVAAHGLVDDLEEWAADGELAVRVHALLRQGLDRGLEPLLIVVADELLQLRGLKAHHRLVGHVLDHLQDGDPPAIHAGELCRLAQQGPGRGIAADRRQDPLEVGSGHGRASSRLDERLKNTTATAADG